MEEQPDVSTECPAEHTVGDAAGNVEENIGQVKANPSSALSESAGASDSSCIPLDAVTAGSGETTMDSESQPSVTVDASAEHHLSEMTGDPESMTDDPGGIVGSERSGAGNEVQHEDMDVSVSCKMETLNFAVSPGPPEANGDCVRSPFTSGALLPQGALLLRDPGDNDDSSTSEDSSSDSDSDSSSTSSSSSSSLGILQQPEDDDDVGVTNGKKPLPIKTQDEILIEDLPTVQDMGVILPEDTEIQPIGVISSIVEQLVIIESLKDTPPLNDDSVVFDEARRSVGKVFEIFGPVCRPYYLLRFNSADHISEKGLKLNDTMYFAPSLKDFTDYIFAEQLKVFKGSDASWKNDQEPPPEALDFSDDELEKLAKQKKKKKKNIQQMPPTSDPSEADESPGRASQHRQPRPAGGGYRGRGVNPHPEGGVPSWRLPQRNAPARPCFYPADSRMMTPPPDPHKLPPMGFPCLFPPPFQPPPPYFLPFPPPPPPHMPMPWPGQEMGPPPPLHGLPFQHLPPPPPPPPPPSS
ncbi:uncharacterized protein naf1 [Paramormyrops kingsleyae]|uniref:H/ACA ribonucleoprotein complex non-core subunit NAF1 n=1 Tax=Paramormyrops kingsleyae TaxID=1676925 RepID=A0A3B3Q442_9TELE|nr:H/ACA ribonucleoprotein complex non-core subunit NAF1 [Paramormyrops kingsleyae]